MSAEVWSLVVSQLGAHTIAVDAAAVQTIGESAARDGCDDVSAGGGLTPASHGTVDLARHLGTRAPPGPRRTYTISSSAGAGLLIAGSRAEVLRLAGATLLPPPQLVGPLLARLGVVGFVAVADELALVLDPAAVIAAAIRVAADEEGPA